MYKFLNLKRDINLSGYTVIIPSVSVGNVGQLTVDLLITSLNLKKVGTIWHPAILPTVGSDPFFGEKKEVCTACELFTDEELKLAAIQLRSGLNFNLAIGFLKELSLALTDHKIKNIVILTTTFAHEMHNIGSNVFRFVTNRQDKETLNRLKMTEIEINFDGKYLIHGSGFATKLYEILKDKIQCDVIVKYTSEGDNRPDAFAMLEVLKKLIGFNIETIVYPSSWQFVFGNPPPIEIF